MINRRRSEPEVSLGGGSGLLWAAPTFLDGGSSAVPTPAHPAVLSSALFVLFPLQKKHSPVLSSATGHIPCHLSTSNTNVIFSVKSRPVPPGCLYVRPTQVYLCLHHRIDHSLTYSSRRCPHSLSLSPGRQALRRQGLCLPSTHPMLRPVREMQAESKRRGRSWGGSLSHSTQSGFRDRTAGNTRLCISR